MIYLNNICKYWKTELIIFKYNTHRCILIYKVYSYILKYLNNSIKKMHVTMFHNLLLAHSHQRDISHTEMKDIETFQKT